MKTAEELVRELLKTGDYDFRYPGDSTYEFYMESLTELLHTYGEQVKEECAKIILAQGQTFFIRDATAKKLAGLIRDLSV